MLKSREIINIKDCGSILVHEKDLGGLAGGEAGGEVGGEAGGDGNGKKAGKQSKASKTTRKD